MNPFLLYVAALFEVLAKIWRHKSLKRLTSSERFVLVLAIVAMVMLVKQGVAY